MSVGRVRDRGLVAEAPASRSTTAASSRDDTAHRNPHVLRRWYVVATRPNSRTLVSPRRSWRSRASRRAERAVDYDRVKWPSTRPRVALWPDRGQCQGEGLRRRREEGSLRGNSERRSSATPRRRQDHRREAADGTAGQILGVHMAGPWGRTTRRRYFAVNWEAYRERGAALINRTRLFPRLSRDAVCPRRSGSTLADVTLPSLGESVTEGIIISGSKGGRHGRRDEPLFECRPTRSLRDAITGSRRLDADPR